MQSIKDTAKLADHRNKLTQSYNQLLEEFSTKDLHTVGNYSVSHLIGKGSFGKVYLAQHKLTNGSKVVLKSAKKDDSNLAREIHHHRQFLHPHIVRLYEVIVTESQVWLVLEYCPGNELYNYILKHGAPSLEKVQKIFAQLVGAVKYMHNMHCVHRDLKLENILLDKHENVKLCDFGFTREYEGTKAHLQTFCGTMCYSAPEMVKGEKYAGEKVDVWSLGIILYTLLVGQLPFDDDDDLTTKHRIMSEEPNYPDTMPEDAKSLLKLMLNKRPLHRPALSDVLLHPFLKGHAEAQQTILDHIRPQPFTTQIESDTLLRLRSAGVNVETVKEAVLAQRCDSLAGWWNLLIEKETHKMERREAKRKLKDLDSAGSKRMSVASSMHVIGSHTNDRIVTPRSMTPHRGRPERRSIIIATQQELPSLIEDTQLTTPTMEQLNPIAVVSPLPPRSDSLRNHSTSRTRMRPAVPPKDFTGRRPSRVSMHVVYPSEPFLAPTNESKNNRSKRKPIAIITQLSSIKQWFMNSTSKSKAGSSKGEGSSPNSNKPSTTNSPAKTINPADHPHQPAAKAALPSKLITTFPETEKNYPSRPTNGPSPYQSPRGAGSPTPQTPRSQSFRRASGLSRRKSTSSSVSSLRSLHGPIGHSKASSISSNSTSARTSTLLTPSILKSPPANTSSSSRATRSTLRTPTTSSPTARTFPSPIRLVRTGAPGPLKLDLNIPPSTSTYALTGGAMPSPGLVYAKRRKTPFKGPVSSYNSNHTSQPLHNRSREPSSASGTRRRSRLIVVAEDEEDENEDEEAVTQRTIVYDEGTIRRSVHSTSQALSTIESYLANVHHHRRSASARSAGRVEALGDEEEVEEVDEFVPIATNDGMTTVEIVDDEDEKEGAPVIEHPSVSELPG